MCCAVLWLWLWLCCAVLCCADLEVSEIDDLVKSKFQYVVSCQVYGQQKRELDPKATDIDFLLARHPNLRVAYIDNRKARTASGATKDEFFSVLIKSVPVWM